MSSVGPPLTSQNSHSTRLSSKRKLEDLEGLVTRICKISSFTGHSISKGKSAIDHGIESSSSRVRAYGSIRREFSSPTAEPASFELQFFVRVISEGKSKTLVLRANFDDTVEMVQRRIYLLTGIPAPVQRLIYKGKQLQSEDTLKQSGIQNDGGLELVGRMRSTYLPQAWRVISDLVSIICRICRKELRLEDPCLVVKIRLEQFMSLPLYDSKLNVDADGELTGNTDQCNPYRRRNFCIIDAFRDSCAVDALVMLYMSKEKHYQDCADKCIRSFVSYLKDLNGSYSQRSYFARVVLDFCTLLQSLVSEENLLYIHCRSTLGAMLEKVDVRVGHQTSRGYVVCEDESNCISFKDVFPFWKEIGQKLVKDLALSVESKTITGPLPRDVCDFSAFLRPVLCFFGKYLTSSNHSSSKGKKNASDDETCNIFMTFHDLLCGIDKCLHFVQLHLDTMTKKTVKTEMSGWAHYLAILKELHNISLFCPRAENLFWTTIRQNKTAVCDLVVRYVKRTDDHTWIATHKDVLDFEARRHFAMLLFPDMKEDYNELHEMLIDRSNLLAESFEYISSAKTSALHSGIFMEFKNETATGPGVLREWFCLVSQAIFDPQNALFVSCPSDRRRFFPSAASKVHPLHLRYFRFSGRVIAMALMHKIQIGVVLDRVFYLQLAGKGVTMEDIRDADPCIYNSCKQILEMDPAFVDSDGLGLTFVTEVEELGERKVVELCSGGKDIAVNSTNRKKYVNLIVQHHFVESIAEQVSYFAQGFGDILSEGNYQRTFFKCLELEDFDSMLHGSESEICVQDWKSHTEYTGYIESDPQIVWFWEVVEQLNAEQKSTLLFFWTSVKYLPVEGFRGLASRVHIYKSFDSLECLPTSHTCFYRLCIPPYQSKADMQKHLLLITQEHVGCSFGTL